MKCPRCRNGKVFKVSNPYRLKHVGDMNELCPVCNLNFRPEPGFYFGGAMISYPLMVFFSTLIALIFYFVVGDLFHHIPAVLITLFTAALLITPLFFRYSRIIFLYILIRYEPKK